MQYRDEKKIKNVKIQIILTRIDKLIFNKAMAHEVTNPLNSSFTKTSIQPTFKMDELLSVIGLVIVGYFQYFVNLINYPIKNDTYES